MNIYINNEPVVLFADTKIPAVFSNTFFSADGSHSFEISIPYHDNARLFGLPALPSSAMRNVNDLTAVIDLDTRVIECVCRLTKANKNKIGIMFLFNESSFYKTIEGITLDQLPFPDDININVPQISAATASMTAPVTDPELFLFNISQPILNPSNAFNSQGNDYMVYQIRTDQNASPNNLRMLLYIDHSYIKMPNDARKLYLRVYEYDSVTTNTNYYHIDITDKSRRLILITANLPVNSFIYFSIGAAIHPWFLFSTATVPYFVNFFSCTVLETYPLLQPDHQKNDYNFFPAQLESVSQKVEDLSLPGVSYPGYANYFDGTGKFPWVMGVAGKDPFLNLLVPSLFIPFILDAIYRLTGYRIVLPDNIPDLQNMVIPGTISLVNLEWFSTGQNGLYRNVFNPSQILPSKSISDLLAAIESLTGSFISVNEEQKKVEFILRRNVLLSEPADDFSDSLVDISFENEEKPTGFILKYADHADEFFTQRFASLSELNLLGTTNLSPAQLPATGNKPADCWLIQNSIDTDANNCYYAWDGNFWSFVSRFPTMEILFNHKSKKVFEYIISFLPILSIKINSPSTLNHVVPVTRLQCVFINDAIAEHRKSMPLIFSMYRGLQPYIGFAYNYMMLSHDVYNSLGELIPGNLFSAQINTEHGIFPKLLEQHLFFLMHRNDKFECYFDGFPDMVFRKEKITVNGSDFITESQEFDFFNRKVSGIRAILRQVN